MHKRLEAFVRQSGKQLEDAFQQTGSRLPPELSGEAMVRSFIDGSFERGLDEATRQRIEQWRAAIAKIVEQLKSELPGAHSNPEFEARFVARVEQWRNEHPELS